jgi:hypothetical protein
LIIVVLPVAALAAEAAANPIETTSNFKRKLLGM